MAVAEGHSIQELSLLIRQGARHPQGTPSDSTVLRLTFAVCKTTDQNSNISLFRLSPVIYTVLLRVPKYDRLHCDLADCIMQFRVHKIRAQNSSQVARCLFAFGWLNKSCILCTSDKNTICEKQNLCRWYHGWTWEGNKTCWKGRLGK